MIVAGSMRSRLREATAETHERMHAHPGFADAAAGAISLVDYRWLLRRLYGFHRAFEIAQAGRPGASRADARGRSHLIVADLDALGVDADTIAQIPLCDALSPPRGEAEALGALYVIEGSTLGGVQIARALQAVVGGSDGSGRRFYLGYGDRHGAMWRAFLEELEALAGRRAEADAAVRAAMDTFEQFERWMRDWRPVYAAPAGAAIDLTH